MRQVLCSDYIDSGGFDDILDRNDAKRTRNFLLFLNRDGLVVVEAIQGSNKSAFFLSSESAVRRI